MREANRPKWRATLHGVVAEEVVLLEMAASARDDGEHCLVGRRQSVREVMGGQLSQRMVGAKDAREVRLKASQSSTMTQISASRPVAMACVA